LVAKVQKDWQLFGIVTKKHYFCSSMEVKYRHDLDLLKGLAIIAVVLYHAGWCKSGFISVYMFLFVRNKISDSTGFSVS